MRRLLKLCTLTLCLVVFFASASLNSAGQQTPRHPRRARAGDAPLPLPPVSLGEWSQMGQLIQQNGQYFGEFGVSVAIEGDTIAICNLSNTGAFIFVRPPTGWKDMLPTAVLSAGAASVGSAELCFQGADKSQLARAKSPASDRIAFA
jgi:hypothetical protein